ncbi:hypothetical protein CC80DRAFT_530558 [Byssothecium circinans]|uniref:Uncharacterized protein n=1 Tax=Byssothecium circinans TaxID=147558 RepID=A0A6A5UHH9_9PLEO|nr:hypothetical protein CC80DRAFT_530558 [Byssothecium circinans]
MLRACSSNSALRILLSAGALSSSSALSTSSGSADPPPSAAAVTDREREKVSAAQSEIKKSIFFTQSMPPSIQHAGPSIDGIKYTQDQHGVRRNITEYFRRKNKLRRENTQRRVEASQVEEERRKGLARLGEELKWVPKGERGRGREERMKEWEGKGKEGREERMKEWEGKGKEGKKKKKDK